MNKIFEGDALTILSTLPSESVDCVMTSPPYWALRDYGVEGQLGLEENFEEYITKLCDIFDEVKRVLKKSGTCWVNMGDTYYTKSGSNFENDNLTGKNRQEVSKTTGINKANQLRGRGLLQDKSLCLIPMRFAIEMSTRGWILRNDIVWFKRNSMPTSVKDRFANKWEHLFFFVKHKKYYFNLDAVRKPHLHASADRIRAGFSKSVAFNYRVREAAKVPLAAKFGQRYDASPEEIENYGSSKPTLNSLGGNPGDHWDITTKPHKFAHFAVYPEQLCEMPIKAGCAIGGTVLDPFFGSGTTGIVALKQSKQFIGIELNPSYITIAQERLKPFLEQKTLDRKI